jgi:hypothetical protein
LTVRPVKTIIEMRRYTYAEIKKYQSSQTHLGAGHSTHLGGVDNATHLGEFKRFREVLHMDDTTVTSVPIIPKYIQTKFGITDYISTPVSVSSAKNASDKKPARKPLEGLIPDPLQNKVIPDIRDLLTKVSVSNLQITQNKLIPMLNDLNDDPIAVSQVAEILYTFTIDLIYLVHVFTKIINILPPRISNTFLNVVKLHTFKTLPVGPEVTDASAKRWQLNHMTLIGTLVQLGVIIDHDWVIGIIDDYTCAVNPKEPETYEYLDLLAHLLTGMTTIEGTQRCGLPQWVTELTHVEWLNDLISCFETFAKVKQFPVRIRFLIQDIIDMISICDN